MPLYTLQFPDYATFLDLAAAEGLIAEDDQLITCSHAWAIDEVGTIYEGGTPLINLEP